MPDDPISVLVVEDEESYVDALAIGLPRSGFVVHVARTGPEALRLFRALSPALVLLDVMIPEISGVEVCRLIRVDSSVPIILVTARAEEANVAIGLAAGADAYVTKPYRLRDLVTRMRAVVASQQRL